MFLKLQGNTSVPAGMQLPPNFGGGIGANLGGNAGLLAGFGGSQQPKPQFQQPVGGPGVGGMMNNPFLAMAQPSRSDQNNVSISPFLRLRLLASCSCSKELIFAN